MTAIHWWREPFGDDGASWWVLRTWAAEVPGVGATVEVPSRDHRPDHTVIVTAVLPALDGATILHVVRAPGTREVAWDDIGEPPGRHYWPIHMERPEDPAYHRAQRRLLDAAAEHARRYNPCRDIGP